MDMKIHQTIFNDDELDIKWNEYKNLHSEFDSAFDECISSIDTNESNLSPPLQPLHIEPTHYVTTVSINRIRECIEAFCTEFKTSFEINMETYTYNCVYINDRINECYFRINLFTGADGVIIEIQRMSGDGFAFVDVVRALKYWLQINEVISNPNESSYNPIEALKLSAKISSTPSIYIDPSIVKQTVQNMIELTTSLYINVAEDAITTLASESAQPNVLHAIMSNLRTRTLIYTRLGSSDRKICYCILVIIQRILSTYPEKKYLFENLLPEIINTMHRHTLPQIWEKCTELLLLFEKPIDPVNMVAILEKLRSNPFPTLEPLALKLEAF